MRGRFELEKLDCIVVGAGVIGLAIARGLAESGRDVIVLETEAEIGTQTSSRNSEVIHSGIYYPNDSLKARFCVAGKKLLYRYCEEYGVPFSRTGKVIVATTNDEIETLRNYLMNATANGVNDLTLISANALQEREPAVPGVSALLSPGTGIVSSHDLMISLQGNIEAAGGSVICRSSLSDAKVDAGKLVLSIDGDTTVECTTFINAAGLNANKLAEEMTGFPATHVPGLHLSIGHYYALRGKSPFTGLVYPVASGGGLGIHATLDLGGSVRFGPDIRPIDSIDYEFDDSRRDAFIAAIQKYYPDLDPSRLQPAYTGIRPKLVAPGEGFADFCIQGPADHGIPGLINLFGIESPGLTSSLAIADYVSELVAAS